MWIVLAIIVAVVVAVVAVAAFPGSPVAVAVGWSIYLVLGLVTQPWGMATLAGGAAIAPVWWTLTRE